MIGWKRERGGGGRKGDRYKDKERTREREKFFFGGGGGGGEGEQRTTARELAPKRACPKESQSGNQSIKVTVNHEYVETLDLNIRMVKN